MQMPNNDKAYANTHAKLNLVLQQRAFVCPLAYLCKIMQKYL